MPGSLLTGRTALITGAASGIGAAAALVFAQQGAAVALSDINEDGGRQTAASVEELGGQALFLPADVSSETDVAAMVKAATDHFGRIDCAFNNAGIDGESAPVHESTEKNWDLVLATDLTGVWLCMKYEIRQMLQQGAGSIVNCSSAAGIVGFGLGVSAYVAAKHGVVGLTRAAALEYATRRIRVNAVCPGTVRTKLLDDAIRQGYVDLEQVSSMQPMRRLAAPAEVAEAAAWLCSDAASYVTGHPLAVDGGLTAA